MPRSGTAPLLLAVVAAAGCGAMTGPTEGGRLAAARAQWNAAGMGSYRIEMMTMCECLLAGEWIEVTVAGGQVTSGRLVDSGTALEPAALAWLPTVPALFDRIQHAINERAVLLEVEYDPADGHPTLINVDISRTIVDEEYVLRVRRLARAGT